MPVDILLQFVKHLSRRGVVRKEKKKTERRFLTILCCKAALANNRGATVAGQRSDRYPQAKKDYSALGERGATTI